MRMPALRSGHEQAARVRWPRLCDKKRRQWRRSTRGWLGLGQVKPPGVDVVGCSPVELACLACELASGPNRWVVRGGEGPRIRRLVTFARHVVQMDTCSPAVSGQEARHVRSGGGTTAHPLRGASTPSRGGVSQGASTRTHTCLPAWDFPSQGGDSPTLGEIPWLFQLQSLHYHHNFQTFNHALSTAFKVELLPFNFHL